MSGGIERLQLHNIRDGTADVDQLCEKLRKVMVEFLTQYGDVSEYGEEIDTN